MPPLPLSATRSATPLGIIIQPGPITPALRKSIEQAVAPLVPKGKRVGVVAVLQHDGTFVAGAAFRNRSGHLHLGGDVTRAWGGRVSGQVYFMGSW